MIGNLPRPSSAWRRSTRRASCRASEHTDLKNAVARYKANGNKYVGDVVNRRDFAVALHRQMRELPRFRGMLARRLRPPILGSRSRRNGDSR